MKFRPYADSILILLLQSLLFRALHGCEALSSFVSDVGFCSIDAKVVFKDLETNLKMYGPFYTSGALSVLRDNINKVQKRTGAVGTGDSKGKGDQVVAVYELKENSAHAVVAVGVNGDSVYYKDPNSTAGILVMPFVTFTKNVKGEMLYLDCDVSKDDKHWSCLHNRTRVLDASNPTLAPRSDAILELLPGVGIDP